MQAYGSDTYEDTPRMGGLDYLGLAAITILAFVGMVALWLLS